MTHTDNIQFFVFFMASNVSSPQHQDDACQKHRLLPWLSLLLNISETKGSKPTCVARVVEEASVCFNCMFWEATGFQI